VFSIVVAMDANRGIGVKGKLPWKLSGDMKFFRELTTCPDHEAVERRYGLGSTSDMESLLPVPSPNRRNAVIMGRHTWESIPSSFKPLPNRLNWVLSRRVDPEPEGTHQVRASFQEAIDELHRDESVSEVFVIGGGQIYAHALASPGCGRIYLTSVEGSFSCDAFFPEIPSGFREAATSDLIEEAGIRYRFRLLLRDIK
jgi:dihydrofolate reductase